MIKDIGSSARSPKPRWALTVLAWIVILGVAAVIVVGNQLAANETASTNAVKTDGASIGAVDVQAQALARLAAAGMALDPEFRPLLGDLDDETDQWEERSLALHLARVILLASIDEPDAARSSFDSAVLDAQERDLTERAAPLFRVVADLLRHRGDGNDSSNDFGAWTAPDDDDLVVAHRHLGDFVTLGQAYLADDSAAMASISAVGLRLLVVLVLFTFWIGAALLTGLAAIITLLILVADGRVRSGTGPARRDSQVLIEVFALYMALYFGVSRLLDWVVDSSASARSFAAEHEGAMTIFSVALTIGSILAGLGWWTLRGGSWSTLRDAAGLHIRPGVWRSIGTGFLGYSMAAVLAAAGLLVSVILAKLAGVQGLGNPQHPVHEILGGDSTTAIVVIMIFGVIVAPIVEEIAFRGVLYRGIRDAFGPSKAALVVGAVSGLALSSSIFAAIHPQGLLFAPVLAGMGAGFCLVREWTGSVAPGILAHAINNGVILSLGLFVLA